MKSQKMRDWAKLTDRRNREAIEYLMKIKSRNQRYWSVFMVVRRDALGYSGHYSKAAKEELVKRERYYRKMLIKRESSNRYPVVVFLWDWWQGAFGH